ncbi:MAG: response regulator [Rhodospirillales bacterium]|nr:response regulator [Alphaproteobacteria bacterium]MBL6948603.1 response regulator [Rhodospirillales bacterium]
MLNPSLMDRHDGSLGGVRVILHDTNREWLRILTSELKTMGLMKVDAARTPKDVLVALKTGEYDVVITHWDKKLISFIRRNPASPKPEIPIILVTSGIEMQMILGARDLGCNEIVAKPASTEQVYKHIKTVVTKDREFIRAEKFIGPDRRRHSEKSPGGVERRQRRSS